MAAAMDDMDAISNIARLSQKDTTSLANLLYDLLSQVGSKVVDTKMQLALTLLAAEQQELYYETVLMLIQLNGLIEQRQIPDEAPKFDFSTLMQTFFLLMSLLRGLKTVSDYTTHIRIGTIEHADILSLVLNLQTIAKQLPSQSCDESKKRKHKDDESDSKKQRKYEERERKYEEREREERERERERQRKYKEREREERVERVERERMLTIYDREPNAFNSFRKKNVDYEDMRDDTECEYVIQSLAWLLVSQAEAQTRGQHEIMRTCLPRGGAYPYYRGYPIVLLLQGARCKGDKPKPEFLPGGMTACEVAQNILNKGSLHIRLKTYWDAAARQVFIVANRYK